MVFTTESRISMLNLRYFLMFIVTSQSYQKVMAEKDMQLLGYETKSAYK